MSFAAPAHGRSVAAAAIGNVLAWYDFVVYIYLAAIISRKFFPAYEEMTMVLSAVGAFGVGYIARPIGAIVIGRLADRRGRKPALLLSIYLMAGATLALGLLPTHASIGIAAPLILIAVRIVQGFSIGGEWGVATSYMVELAPKGRRGLFGGLQQAGVVAGLFLGSASAAVLYALLTPEEMSDWGWRLPFLAGGTLGLVGLYMRQALIESPTIERAARTAPPYHASNIGRAGQAFGLTIAWAVSVYLMINYMPLLTQHHLKLTTTQALWANSVVLLALACATPLMGRLSDRIGRKPLLLGACLLFVILPFPLFGYLGGPDVSLAGLIGAQLLFVLAVAAFSGVGPTALAELFPGHLRAGWMTPSFTLAIVIFGGFLPYYSIGRLTRFDLSTVYSVYLIVAAVVSAAEIMLMRETAFDELA